MQANKNIEEIIESYNSRIRNVIRKFLKTDNDIDDIQQEVYIKTWKNISNYRGESLWGWINKITVNACRDHLRAGKIVYVIQDSEENEIVSNIPDKNSGPETKSILSERHKLILNSINKLNPKLREVVLLYDIEDMSYDEIAGKIQCPVGTVKSRLFNARKILKQELQELLNS